jgi:hypothetical protein
MFDPSSWPGVVPAIHAFAARKIETWMPATSAGMTEIGAAAVA